MNTYFYYDSISGMSLKEIKNGIFLGRQTSKHMQRIIEECNSKENIIMSHCMNEKEKMIKKNG